MENISNTPTVITDTLASTIGGFTHDNTREILKEGYNNKYALAENIKELGYYLDPKFGSIQASIHEAEITNLKREYNAELKQLEIENRLQKEILNSRYLSEKQTDCLSKEILSHRLADRDCELATLRIDKQTECLINAMKGCGCGPVPTPVHFTK